MMTAHRRRLASSLGVLLVVCAVGGCASQAIAPPLGFAGSEAITRSSNPVVSPSGPDRPKPELGDYRTWVTPAQLERYRTLDKYRAIEVCGFVDLGAVGRFLSPPLYVGPDILSGVGGCSVNLNPNRTPLAIDSLSITTAATPEPWRRPDEMLGGRAVFVDRLGARCTLSTLSPTGLLVGFRVSQTGQTTLSGSTTDVCGPARQVLNASLPRVTAPTPPGAAVTRTRGSRLDPCTVLNGIHRRFPQATTLSAQSSIDLTNTAECRVLLDGPRSADKRQPSVTVRLQSPESALAPPKEASLLRVLGVPATETSDLPVQCEINVFLGYGDQVVTPVEWTTLRTFDVNEQESKPLIDSATLYGSDCTTLERMAVALTAAYQGLR